MNEIQLDLKKLWVIFTLLDGSKKTQKQIGDEIDKIDENIKKMKDNSYVSDLKFVKSIIKDERRIKKIEDEWSEELEKIKDEALIEFNKTSPSKIFVPLEKEGIIKRKDIYLENKNFLPKCCWIPDNFDTLLNVNKLISNSRIDPIRKTFFRHYFVTTNLGKKLIHEIIALAPRLLNDLEPPLDEKELEIVETLITVSPSCLLHVTKYMDDKSENKDRNKLSFLFKLQANFMFEITHPEVVYAHPINRDIIEFDTRISLRKRDVMDGNENPELIIKRFNNDELKMGLEFIPPSKDRSYDTFIQMYFRSYRGDKRIFSPNS